MSTKNRAFSFYTENPIYCVIYEEKPLYLVFICLFDSNCNRNSHTNHGVIACADKSHHLYVGGDGGGSGELGVGVHTAHGVGHTVAGGAGSHIIGVEGTAGTAARGDREVADAVLVAPLLIGAGDGMLEAGGVGGVTGDGDADILQLHDGHALGDIIRAIATDIGTGALGEGLFLDDRDGLGIGIKGGLDIGEAIDTCNDVSGILAQTVQDDTEGLGAHLVGVQCDLDRTFGSGEGLVAGEETETFGLLGEEHFTEVTVAKTNLTVLGHRAGDAERLQTDTDSGGGFSGLLAALLDGDGCTNGVGPLGVFKADGLCTANYFVAVNARRECDFLTLVD